MELWHDFHGPNAGWVLELYDRYREDPASVDAATRAMFERWTPPTNGEVLVAPAPGEAAPPAISYAKIQAVTNLVQAIRAYGHLAAQLDPLGSEPTGDPELELSYYDLTPDDLRQLPASLVDCPTASDLANAWEAIQLLRDVYSSTIGFDSEHIRLPEQRSWLREAAESRRFRPDLRAGGAEADFARELLRRLTQVETFELFIHRIFPGKTRFSIEGLDVMVPMLDEMLQGAAEAGINAILLGMAHRGRLNVLAHILGKSYSQILAEFKDPLVSRIQRLRDDLGWTGDVKYHSGARRQVAGDQSASLTVTMAPNPSHLEHVNPIVAGMARAAGTDVSRPGPPQFDPIVSLPILIHGDASFPGQGVVSETLNMFRLPGYNNGGTIHIIANNQLGFTTLPNESRSTRYASDLAKGFQIPVIHVNADDPVACIEVARMALAYQQTFHKDILIDLIGYRRYGHNEGDEPRFTQPVMYAGIDDHPTARALWADRLVAERIVDASEPQKLVYERMAAMQQSWEELEPVEELPDPELELPPAGAARRVQTAVPLDQLQALNQALVELPDEFNLNPKLKRALSSRRSVLDAPDETTVDWATAEGLALASILADGVAIRLTGEDVKRGTFSHRHAVFFDAATGQEFVPLQHIPQARAAFEIHNSPLTENATVGFEYGYNVQAPERLVLWEAQYGDFINGAQVMIDEFIVSGRAKWGQTPSLVLLLPHGYEGAGPDHSTGRLERFLQQAARTNMRVANPTTAAQYFHLLRRQSRLLTEDPLPLIVMTPKSLLRHRLSASKPRELAEGRWQPVIDDDGADPSAVRRLILCSGKVYVDLVTSDYRAAHPEIAIARVEQIYPFPGEALEQALARYEGLAELVWVQEEPRNMGAWDFARYYVETAADGRYPVHYIGRPRRASPAEGSSTWHKVNQENLVERAFAPIEAA